MIDFSIHAHPFSLLFHDFDDATVTHADNVEAMLHLVEAHAKIPYQGRMV